MDTSWTHQMQIAEAHLADIGLLGDKELPLALDDAVTALNSVEADEGCSFSDQESAESFNNNKKVGGVVRRHKSARRAHNCGLPRWWY